MVEKGKGRRVRCGGRKEEGREGVGGGRWRRGEAYGKGRDETKMPVGRRRRRMEKKNW